MARSLRSKKGRKLRAKRREQFEPKIVARMKKMLDISKQQQLLGDVQMTDVAQVKSVDDVHKDQAERKIAKSNYNAKTMLNDHGNYPVWMNSRRVTRLKTDKKRMKVIKGKATSTQKRGRKSQAW